MSDTTPKLYAAVLRLSRTDVKNLKIKDAYSLHRVVYDLFDDVRDDAQKQASHPSGILYADKGGDFNSRVILLLADRPPNPNPRHGSVETKAIPPGFLQHTRYAFEVTVNPTKRDHKTGKILAVRGYETQDTATGQAGRVSSQQAVADWFMERAQASWGFQVMPHNLQVDKITVQRFSKTNGGPEIVHGSATLKGELQVTDRAQFLHSFSQGIGRGRAFGFGLLQIVALPHN